VREREEFISTMGQLDPKKLVFIDESGFKTNLRRNYGWAPIGVRPIIYGDKFGKNVTIIGAIALDGLRATRVIEGTLDGPGFIAFLDEDLGPALVRDDIVVMDGPRLHRVAGVEEALAAHHAKVLYLPRYSPELNPIEMCWSLMKAWVRTRAPHVASRLIDAVEEAWGKVTSELCKSWVRHCGYAVAST
jgi:transposase